MSITLMMAAAGSGTRIGHERPKALIEVAGVPLIVRALERFAPLGLTDDAVIVVPPGRTETFAEVLREAFPQESLRFTEGGVERQTSIANGLAALDEDTDLVVIHDAARPFISEIAIKEVIEAAKTVGAATVAVPCADTILVADDQRALKETPDRSRLWACQTPQVFAVEVIRAAHAEAAHNGARYTDDATLVREHGGTVRIIEGSALNLKITTQQDLVYAEYLIKENLI